MSFPRGSTGTCHPFNLEKFDLLPECNHLYGLATQLPRELWEPGILRIHEFASELLNCSTVQQCSLGTLFLNTGVLSLPGVDRSAATDYWRQQYWMQMQKRVRRFRRRRIRQWLHLKRLELKERQGGVHPSKEDVTIGMHADSKSASGPWRGQLRAWEAFAEVQQHRFWLDMETYFDGQVFAGYLGLFWASSTKADDFFWSKYPFLQPATADGRTPSGSFLEARMDEQEVLDKLVIFNQPPGFWDSLEALGAALIHTEWLVWLDFDLTLSPCCFDSFSFTHLVGQTADGGLPDVIIRDSPREDYHHHCANAGFLVVRNSPVGRFFIDLAREKRHWPNIPYGYQSALAESLLELLGIEAEIYGDKERYHHECIHHLVLGRPLGDSSYANYCHCWREQLDRLTGSDRDRSRWVQFWDGRKGPEVGFLLASIFLHRATYEDRTRGTGYLPRHTWSREKHQRYVEAWIPDEFEFGGPCALLPLSLHWASLHHRPALLYHFLSDRFESFSLELLANGSKAEIKDAFLAAGEEGRRQWHEFKTGLQAEAGLPAVWRMPSSLEASVQDHLDDATCNLGSQRLWVLGGWTRHARSTDIE